MEYAVGIVIFFILKVIQTAKESSEKDGTPNWILKILSFTCSGLLILYFISTAFHFLNFWQKGIFLAFWFLV